MTTEFQHQLLETLCRLICEIKEIKVAITTNMEGSKPHHQFATKRDLEEMEDRIMAKLEDLIAASSALSTASDGLSVKLDKLIVSVDAFIAAVGSGNLSPAGEAALVALNKSKDIAAAAGDKVDAEVAKVDTTLPTPAPAGV